MKKFLIDRRELPYDAMVPDASWLIPIAEKEKDGDGTDDAEAEELQTDEIHGRELCLQ